MKVMKIGIMPREQFQQRMLDIASGRYTPKRGEPKIWFSSLKSACEVLSEKNVQLLELINERKPNSMTELADISGRTLNNLSRTLKTMERYGIVELRIRPNQKSKQPIAKATAFRIEYTTQWHQDDYASTG